MNEYEMQYSNGVSSLAYIGYQTQVFTMKSAGVIILIVAAVLWK